MGGARAARQILGMNLAEAPDANNAFGWFDQRASSETSNFPHCLLSVRFLFPSFFFAPHFLGKEMRNLTLISSWESQITTAKVTATTFDLDENVIYAASEAPNLDGEVDVALWKIDQSAGFNKPPVRASLDPLGVRLH